MEIKELVQFAVDGPHVPPIASDNARRPSEYAQGDA